MTTQAHRSSPWRVALPAVLLAWVLILFLYRDTAVAMVTIWYRSETFTHGFVVLPITLWLIWRRRQDLALLVPRPAPWLLILFAGLPVMWLLGDLVAVNAVTQFALVAMLVVAVPTVLGLQVARAITFPLVFLFFAVPIGEFMMPQLMEWTADFTIAALRLSSIPVYREGLQFVIPSGNWSVVEACSGVRYLIASLTVGTLFAYLNYQSTTRRVLFILVSILVPVIANWLRAYMIVMLGHLSGNTLAVGVDHLIYGWVFFGVVILLMFFIGARWSEPDHVPGSGARASTASMAAFSSTGLWLVTAVLVALVAAPNGALLALERSANPGVPVLDAPATLATGWQAADAASIGFKPAFKNPSVETNTVYTNGGQAVGVYLAYYRNQDYDRKLISSSNVLVESKNRDWSRVGGGKRQLVFGQSPASVRTIELRRLGHAMEGQSERLLVWQVYWIDGTLTASDYLAKVYSALYRLMGRGDESAALVLYTAKDAPGGGEAALASFVASNAGALDALLREASQGR